MRPEMLNEKTRIILNRKMLICSYQSQDPSRDVFKKSWLILNPNILLWGCWYVVSYQPQDLFGNSCENQNPENSKSCLQAIHSRSPFCLAPSFSGLLVHCLPILHLPSLSSISPSLSLSLPSPWLTVHSPHRPRCTLYSYMYRILTPRLFMDAWMLGRR